MFFRQILHDDLGCASYLIADGARPTVIDPKWEIEEYLQLADENGFRITSILESTTTPTMLVLDLRTCARFMGCGVRVLDRTYGHFVPGSEDRARERLDRRLPTRARRSRSHSRHLIRAVSHTNPVRITSIVPAAASRRCCSSRWPS